MSDRMIKGDINHVFGCGMKSIVKESEGAFLLQRKSIQPEAIRPAGWICTYV